MRLFYTTVFILISTKIFGCSCGLFGTFKTRDDLKPYNFVAIVKITELPAIISNQKFMRLRVSGDFKADILEQFKGDATTAFSDPSFESDCALQLNLGEEWLFFGYLYEGKMQISKCSYTTRYRSVDGEREWTYFTGIKELNNLRLLYNHPVESNKVNKQFYPNGKIEVEQNFKNGRLTGKRTFYRPTGAVKLIEEFKNGTRVGYRRTYDTAGHLISETKYKKGIKRYVHRYQDTAEHAWYINYQKKHHNDPLFGEKEHNTQYFVKLLDSLRSLKHWDKEIAFRCDYSKDGMSYRKTAYNYKGDLISETYQDWNSKINEACNYYANSKLQYTVIMDGKNDTNTEYDYKEDGSRKDFKTKCNYCYLYFDKNNPESKPEEIYIQ